MAIVKETIFQTLYNFLNWYFVQFRSIWPLLGIRLTIFSFLSLNLKQILFDSLLIVVFVNWTQIQGFCDAWRSNGNSIRALVAKFHFPYERNLEETIRVKLFFVCIFRRLFRGFVPLSNNYPKIFKCGAVIFVNPLFYLIFLDLCVFLAYYFNIQCFTFFHDQHHQRS